MATIWDERDRERFALAEVLGEPHTLVEYRADMTNRDASGRGSVALSYGDYEPAAVDRHHAGCCVLWYVPGLLAGSDYSGDSVEDANYRAILRDYGERPGIVRLYGGYGTFGIAIRAAAVRLYPDLREDLARLFDYPIVDEELDSEVEREYEDSAWENYVAAEVRDHLCLDYSDGGRCYECDACMLSDSEVRERFESAASAANVYWFEHTGGSATIRVAEVYPAGAVRIREDNERRERERERILRTESLDRPYAESWLYAYSRSGYPIAHLRAGSAA